MCQMVDEKEWLRGSLVLCRGDEEDQEIMTNQRESKGVAVCLREHIDLSNYKKLTMAAAQTGLQNVARFWL